MDLDWAGISAFSHSPPLRILCFHLLVLPGFPLWLCEFACLCAFKWFLAYIGPQILIHILFVWIYTKFRVRRRKWLPLCVSHKLYVCGFHISTSFQLKQFLQSLFLHMYIFIFTLLCGREWLFWKLCGESETSNRLFWCLAKREYLPVWGLLENIILTLCLLPVFFYKYSSGCYIIISGNFWFHTQLCILIKEYKK